MVATAPITSGEVVIRESPFSLVPLPDHSTSRCNLCLQEPLLAPLACSRCTQPRYSTCSPALLPLFLLFFYFHKSPLLQPVDVFAFSRYCSSSCQTLAWSQHHQHECGHLDLLHSVGVGHLAHSRLGLLLTLCPRSGTWPSAPCSLQHCRDF